jgi:hypothetical protein
MNNDPVSILVNRARQLLGLADGSTVDRALIERAVSADAPTISTMSGHAFSADELTEAVRRLETVFVVEQGPALSLKGEKRPPRWYVGDRRKPGPFLTRYLQKLAENDWPEQSLRELSESTARVLEVLDDPLREGLWDWRGLVAGDVQSGKTAHYAGVINRAADAGYRVIVVLAGMHDVLRIQTQDRLDADFLGYETDPRKRKLTGARIPIGVGEINSRLIADSLTMAFPKGDFSQTVANQANFAPLAKPCLLVVKKNARILENLNRWITGLPEESRVAPLLVIDDEADQASVDTKDQPLLPEGTFAEDYDPTRVNGEIRKLLMGFGRSAYVGYTATPFANVLMHDERSAAGYGPDLFPSTFIVSLTPPDDYFGPVAVFGTNDEEESGLPLIRHVDQTTENWIPDRHDKNHRPSFNGNEVIPPSLEGAIDAFLLVCAARAARGQVQAHNSMLVHVSRFVDVHERAHSQVENYLMATRAMISGGDKDTLDRLEAMWKSDFEKTTEKVLPTVFGRQTQGVSWDQVLEQLADSADKIEVLIANGSVKTDIDYKSYKDTGRSLIAIGGDKLSRGLTLEGLSVSYFLRISRQYDSLLQMGRWFGYRRRFADLCRLYTTTDMETWFRHVATATRDLRSQFAHMQTTGATPKEYGLRVESHDVMNVTATNKQRYATERASSYAGEGKIQTVMFRDPALIGSNADIVDGFLEALGSGTISPRRPGPGKRKASGELWSGVSGRAVIDLLSYLTFPSENVDIEGRRLGSYIATMLQEGELTNWTVFLPFAAGIAVTVAGRNFGSIERSPREDRDDPARYIIRSILNPDDEAIDLTDQEYDRALSETNAQRAKDKKPPTDRPSGPEIRRIRGERPEDALLILYPLDPKVAGIDTDRPVFGIMISFPDSANADEKIYLLNRVMTQEEEA